VREVDERKQLLKKALDLLSRRDHAAGELQLKLVARGFDAALIEDTLVYLHDKNYLNDQRFAESFVRIRSDKGYGELDIRSRLIGKGVSKSEIDIAFTHTDVNWGELAREVLQKKLRGTSSVDFARRREKAARFLKSRGFTSEQIYRAVDLEISIDADIETTRRTCD